MEAMSLLRKWCDDVTCRLKEDAAQIIPEPLHPLDISLALSVEQGDALWDLAQKCKENGVFHDHELDLDSCGGKITWKAITPESFQMFAGQHGETMAYAALTKIHESPDSIHSVNSTFLLGKNYLWERVTLLEKDIKPEDDPSLAL